MIEKTELAATFLQQKRDEMRENYNRVLPSNELFFDRFEKARYLGMGTGSSIYDTSVVMGDIVVGENVWVGPYTLLEGIQGKITIGDFVSINTGVMIFCHDSTKYYLTGGNSPFEKGDVTIGSNTVIGSGSIITKGVTIGDHCVIGANSLVTKAIPSFGIAAGTPAKLIGKVEIAKDQKVSFVYFE